MATTQQMQMPGPLSSSLLQGMGQVSTPQTGLGMNIANLLQMMSQYYGSGGLGKYSQLSPMNTTPTSSTPTATTLPQWIQSQLQGNQNQPSPNLSGQPSTLGNNNLPWMQ